MIGLDQQKILQKLFFKKVERFNAKHDLNENKSINYIFKKETSKTEKYI